MKIVLQILKDAWNCMHSYVCVSFFPWTGHWSDRQSVHAFATDGLEETNHSDWHRRVQSDRWVVIGDWWHKHDESPEWEGCWYKQNFLQWYLWDFLCKYFASQANMLLCIYTSLLSEFLLGHIWVWWYWISRMWQCVVRAVVSVFWKHHGAFIFSVGNCWPSGTVSHLRRVESQAPPVWEPLSHMEHVFTWERWIVIVLCTSFIWVFSFFFLLSLFLRGGGGLS